jgi:four helix bundle protein
VTSKANPQGFRDLLVWQKSMQLVKQIYVKTQQFPRDEKFGLTSQIRRAAVSVPSNIAEGQARHSTCEFIQFISNAEGSVAELETPLEIAVELMYCTPVQKDRALSLAEEVRKMLNSLRRRLQGRWNIQIKNLSPSSRQQGLAGCISLVTCHSTLVT